MKKFYAIFMTIVLAFGLLAACGPQESGDSDKNADDNKTAADDANKPEKLVVWEDTEKSKGLEPAIKSFEEEYGIEVEFEEIPMLDQQDKLRLDGPAGTGPDLVTLPHDRIGPAATEGIIAPLEVSDEAKGIFTDASMLAMTYDGKLYGLPKSTETPVFIYNKKLMPEAPATFDELYTYAKENTKGDNYGFLANWTDFYFVYGVVAGHGGYVFGQDNTDPTDIGLNSEGAVAGLDYVAKWYKEGLFPSGIIGENAGQTIDGLFQEGKVGAVMNGPWSFQGYKDAGIDIGIAPMPKLPNGENVKTFMGVKGWMVSNFSENKEWATKLVEWITNEENAKKRFELTAEIPPVKSLIEDPIIAENEGAKAVAEQSAVAVPMPNIPEMAEVWDPMKNALTLAATKKQEPKAALEEAVKTIKQNIETNHSGN